MVGGVPGLPPPNMPGQLGNISTMGDQKTLLPNMQGSNGNMPMTGGSYVHPPSTHGPTEKTPQSVAQICQNNMYQDHMEIMLHLL